MPVGGDQERVEIHLIAHPDDEQTQARRLLTEQFATFDAGKARCFLASDREHLLAVIEAGFGDFYDFNRVARSLLASRLHDELAGVQVNEDMLIVEHKSPPTLSSASTTAGSKMSAVHAAQKWLAQAEDGAASCS